jgi:hypothetical protein
MADAASPLDVPLHPDLSILAQRGRRFLIAVVDGLNGFPEAINAVFPQTIIQTCSKSVAQAPGLRRAN